MSHKVLAVLKGILASISILLAVYSVFLVGPFLETRFFPVVNSFHILRADTVGPGKVAIDLAFNKRRSCEFISVIWYHGKPDGMFNRAIIDTTNVANIIYNRPLGNQRLGPWVLHIPRRDLFNNNSFAEVIHRCHILWPTVSRVYP